MVAYSSLPNSLLEHPPVETLSHVQTLRETHSTSEAVADENLVPQHSPLAIRSSLKASTWDGVFAAIFSSITSGVLLSNFLLELGANPVEIGMLSSVPMLVNFLQPLGAYLAEKTTSRHWYGLWIFAPARLLWLVLVVGIFWSCWHHGDPHQLVNWTLLMVLVTNVMAALGSASWLSWMAALVPQRLRGRYFGIRNSATSLTTLLCIPLLGWGISSWPGGSLEGYSAILFLGVVAGVISVGCQFFIRDVNPQEHKSAKVTEKVESNSSLSPPAFKLEPNFLKFLFYFSFWMFAVNISAPFFNLYLLDNLSIDVKWVTIYGSLSAGANLLMFVFWGKLADKIGNRPLLILVGLLVAATPIMWLGVGNNSLSLWLLLPLLHMLAGGTWAAIDLCNNNLQIDVAPLRSQATYFAIFAAAGGVGGASGTTVGGFLAQFTDSGGLPSLFVLSTILRLVAIFPLLFVQEHRSKPLGQLMLSFTQGLRSSFPVRPRLVAIPNAQPVDRSE